MQAGEKCVRQAVYVTFFLVKNVLGIEVIAQNINHPFIHRNMSALQTSIGNDSMISRFVIYLSIVSQLLNISEGMIV